MSETENIDADRERQLRQLVKRWRSRADMFGDDNDVARRCANMCADELVDVLEDEE